LPTLHQTAHLPEWTALSGAIYAHEVANATFEFQKIVESGASRLRNIFDSAFLRTSAEIRIVYENEVGIADFPAASHWVMLHLGRAALSLATPLSVAAVPSFTRDA
jgi:hypothetical protein